jgi:hypothetical protein
VRSTCEEGTNESLPLGVEDRWLTLSEAALLARRERAQLHIDLGRGNLVGRRVSGRLRYRHPAWEIRLSDLHRYVRTMGTRRRGGARPQKPTELDWALLKTLPAAPASEQAA